jgi:hypothetical protein
LNITPGPDTLYIVGRIRHRLYRRQNHRCRLFGVCRNLIDSIEERA